MNILPIFPVELFWWDYEGNVNLDLNEKNEFQSKNNILDDDCNEELKDFISNCLFEVKSIYDLKCDGLQITTSWLNSYKPNTGLNFHTHPMSAFSGVLFLSDGDPIVFRDPVFSRSSNSTIPISSRNMFFYELEAIKNRLIIFPWWLEHGVSGVSNYRYSLAFNSMPHGKINSDDDLNLSCTNIEHK